MKHHNNLTDDQIHKPKGFIPAANRSLVTKDAQGNLVWEKANYTSSTAITPIADHLGSLHNSYFCLYNSDDAKKYAVYIEINSSPTFVLPTGYTDKIAIDCKSTGESSTAAQIAAQLNTTINAHADFTSSINEAGTIVTISGVQSSTDPVDVSTGFTITTTQTKVANEVLTTDSSGDFKFITKSALSSEIEDVEGTEVKSTGESGGTKFLREDGDGTCSWQTVSASGTVTELTTTGTSGAATLSDGTLNIPQYSGGSGDITQVGLVGDTGSCGVTEGNAELTIAGGTGITTTGNGLTTLTISLSEDKKSKSDIDTLTGVSATNLGTFDGGTIADSRNIKGALQDLESKVESDATTSVKGRASFDSAQFDVSSGAVSAKDATDTVKGVAKFDSTDFTVTSGNVKSIRTEYIHTRFSTNNLNISTTKVDGDGDNLWLIPEVNNNKDLMFSVPVDSLATLYEKALRGSLLVPLTGETWTLTGGKCISSGENGSSYEIAIYSADLDSEQASNVPLTSMGDFNISGSANGNMTHNNIVLDGTIANHKAVEGDGIIMALRSVSDEDENTDYDMRGAITLKFEVSTT